MFRDQYLQIKLSGMIRTTGLMDGAVSMKLKVVMVMTFIFKVRSPER